MKNSYLDKLELTLGLLINDLSVSAGLQESARYMLLNQGKRIRPSITVAILDDLQILNKEHFATALSVEVLHTASLIHDDLPALDNDDYRRGKLSCHKKYSEPLAILLGDYLQTWALQIINKNARGEHLNSLIEVVSEAYQSVCLGQMLDMDQGTEPDFLLINKLKTATLFACSFQMAGIQADWDEDGIELLRRIGEEFGLVFQLINDFKDCFLAPESTGRVDSSDFKNNKQTSINKFETASEAKQFLDEKIVIWNKSFDHLKTSTGNEFPNLTIVLQSVLQAEN